MGEYRDAAIILDLIRATLKIVDFTGRRTKSSFTVDPQAVSAVCFEVAVLGEATKGLSEGLRSAHPEIPWRKIAGMRDRLIHGYNDIDVDELWNTAVRDVPVLLEQLRRIEQELEN